MNWKIPSWWTLDPYEDGTFMLIRVDGIVLSSYQTGMGIWGWCISEGGEHFVEALDEGLITETDNETGESRILPIVAEAAMHYPDPATFLHEVDRIYPVEA